jgi:RimJ/RimL family protein N-acetyltransferase
MLFAGKGERLDYFLGSNHGRFVTITGVTKPILREVPTAIHTERLLIRAPIVGEGAALNAAIVESLDELKAWMPWVNPVPTVEDSEVFTRQVLAKFVERKELQYRLLGRESGEFIGCIGLQLIDWSIPKMEFGYWCRSGLAGQGYISEAVKGLTRLGFDTLGVERLQIRCDARNVRSRRVAEKAGFGLEGTMRRDSRSPDGELRDTCFYALTRPEFEESSPEFPSIEILSW